ncbi:MAG TPA: hypothetical protein VF734_05470 [Pseudonocardiaceae bacterium]
MTEAAVLAAAAELQVGGARPWDLPGSTDGEWSRGVLGAAGGAG